MYISELIEKLQDFKCKYGNLRIYVDGSVISIIKLDNEGDCSIISKYKQEKETW